MTHLCTKADWIARVSLSCSAIDCQVNAMAVEGQQLFEATASPDVPGTSLTMTIHRSSTVP